MTPAERPVRRYFGPSVLAVLALGGCMMPAEFRNIGTMPAGMLCEAHRNAREGERKERMETELEQRGVTCLPPPAPEPGTPPLE